jgi:hypothetical protein
MDAEGHEADDPQDTRHGKHVSQEFKATHDAAQDLARLA